MVRTNLVSKISMLAGSCLMAASLAAPASAEDVTDQALGQWDRTNQGWVVEFSTCGDFLCGEIVSGEGTDRNSGESVVGIQMLFDLERHNETEWRGRMYNPEDGNEYMGKVTILGPDEIRMSGCMVGGLICRSEEWPRTGQ